MTGIQVFDSSPCCGTEVNEVVLNKGGKTCLIL